MEAVFSVVKAFFVGGLICLIGQIILNKTELPPAKILVGFVVVGAILGSVGIYKPILEFAGAGASVPLTGFGYLLSEGVKEAIQKEGFIGIFKGGFTACAVGVSVAIFMGVLVALIFNPKRR